MHALPNFPTDPLTPGFHVPPAPVLFLVLAGGGLADLELLQIPSTDLHVTAVLVHAAGELLRGVGAVPVLLLLLSGLRLGLHLLDGGAGAAAEEATDGVANAGAYRDTTVII